MQESLFDLPARDHHNTTGLRGPELERVRTVARSQQERVLQVFVNNPRVRYGAWDIWEILGGRDPENGLLIGSVRRAITNLEQAVKLEKVEERVPGPYAAVLTWKLRKEEA